MVVWDTATGQRAAVLDRHFADAAATGRVNNAGALAWVCDDGIVSVGQYRTEEEATASVHRPFGCLATT